MESKKKTVYYVCFYAEPEFADNITSYPSAWSKIDYVSDTLKKMAIMFVMFVRLFQIKETLEEKRYKKMIMKNMSISQRLVIRNRTC